MNRTAWNLVSIAALALLGQPAAEADFIFGLTSPSLSGLPGTVVHFDGILSNTDSADVFLNGDSSMLLYATLTVDDLPFFNDTPLFLAPGDSYSGPLFDVDIGIGALPGAYQGSFTIEGGADSNAFVDLATQNFQVTVPASVPEPRSLSLLTVGLGMIALGMRLRTMSAAVCRGMLRAARSPAPRGPARTETLLDL